MRPTTSIAATVAAFALFHATAGAVELPLMATNQVPAVDPAAAAAAVALAGGVAPMPTAPVEQPTNPLEQLPTETTMTPLFVPTPPVAMEAASTETPAPAPVPVPVATAPGVPAAIPSSGPPTSSVASGNDGPPNALRESSTIATGEAKPLLLKDNTLTTTETAPAAQGGSGSMSFQRSNASKAKDDESSATGSDELDSSLSYACVCKDVRKVSLMSASDYCLSPAAVIGNKCGNAAVGEKGECPLSGAQPCQDTGHVLANDSICAFDKRDETYKCVASKEDLYIQKNGKKKKRSSLNSTSKPSAGGSSAAASTGTTALRLVLLVASLTVGLVAVA